jgi:hypothetical protein
MRDQMRVASRSRKRALRFTRLVHKTAHRFRGLAGAAHMPVEF